MASTVQHVDSNPLNPKMAAYSSSYLKGVRRALEERLKKNSQLDDISQKFYALNLQPNKLGAHNFSQSYTKVWDTEEEKLHNSTIEALASENWWIGKFRRPPAVKTAFSANQIYAHAMGDAGVGSQLPAGFITQSAYVESHPTGFLSNDVVPGTSHYPEMTQGYMQAGDSTRMNDVHSSVFGPGVSALPTFSSRLPEKNELRQHERTVSAPQAHSNWESHRKAVRSYHLYVVDNGRKARRHDNANSRTANEQRETNEELCDARSSYSSSSLDRYFSSVQNLHKSADSTDFEPVPEQAIDSTPKKTVHSGRSDISKWTRQRKIKNDSSLSLNAEASAELDAVFQPMHESWKINRLTVDEFMQDVEKGLAEPLPTVAGTLSEVSKLGLSPELYQQQQTTHNMHRHSCREHRACSEEVNGKTALETTKGAADIIEQNLKCNASEDTHNVLSANIEAKTNPPFKRKYYYLDYTDTPSARSNYSLRPEPSSSNTAVNATAEMPQYSASQDHCNMDAQTGRLEQRGVFEQDVVGAVNNRTDAEDLPVIVCPECEEVNREETHWCAECGCVLIGIQPVPMKLWKPRIVERRTSMPQELYSSSCELLNRDKELIRRSGVYPDYCGSEKVNDHLLRTAVTKPIETFDPMLAHDAPKTSIHSDYARLERVNDNAFAPKVSKNFASGALTQDTQRGSIRPVNTGGYLDLFESERLIDNVFARRSTDTSEPTLTHNAQSRPIHSHGTGRSLDYIGSHGGKNSAFPAKFTDNFASGVTEEAPIRSIYPTNTTIPTTEETFDVPNTQRPSVRSSFKNFLLHKTVSEDSNSSSTRVNRSTDTDAEQAVAAGKELPAHSVFKPVPSSSAMAIHADNVTEDFDKSSSPLYAQTFSQNELSRAPDRNFQQSVNLLQPTQSSIKIDQIDYHKKSDKTQNLAATPATVTPAKSDSAMSFGRDVSPKKQNDGVARPSTSKESITGNKAKDGPGLRTHGATGTVYSPIPALDLSAILDTDRSQYNSANLPVEIAYHQTQAALTTTHLTATDPSAAAIGFDAGEVASQNQPPLLETLLAEQANSRLAFAAHAPVRSSTQPTLSKQTAKLAGSSAHYGRRWASSAPKPNFSSVELTSSQIKPKERPRSVTHRVLQSDNYSTGSSSEFGRARKKKRNSLKRSSSGDVKRRQEGSENQEDKKARVDGTAIKALAATLAGETPGSSKDPHYATFTPSTYLPLRLQNTYAKYITMTPRIQEGQVSPWECFPDELLLHVFSFLRQSELRIVAQVCAVFRRVASDDSLWRVIRLEKRTVFDSWLEDIGGHHPRDLYLIRCTGDNVVSRVTNRGLRELFRQSAASLKLLSVAGCSGGAFTGDNIVLHVTGRCRALTYLDLSDTGLSPGSVRALAESGLSLVGLCLNGIHCMDDNLVELLLKKHGSSLKELELSYCINVTCKTLEWATKYCSEMRTFSIGQCYKVSAGMALSKFTRKHKTLENLDLRGIKQLKDRNMLEIINNCRSLKSIALANCNVTDASVIQIAANLPTLKYLDVCGCKLVSDMGMKAISYHCTQIEYLDLSSTKCTSKSVNMLSSYANSRLHTLKLNCLPDINEKCVHRLLQNCKRLRLLHLFGCRKIRDVDELFLLNPLVDIQLHATVERQFSR